MISTGGFTPIGDSNRIDFASRPRVLTIAFALLWLSGWLLLFTIMVLDYKRFGTVSVLEIALLAVGGPPVALALMWVAFGKRESLLLTPGEVRIDRWAGPIPLSRGLEPHAIRGLWVAPASSGPLSDLKAVRQFYSGGNGRVAFDTDRGTFTVGHTISTDDAGRIVERARQLVPPTALRSRARSTGNADAPGRDLRDSRWAESSRSRSQPAICSIRANRAERAAKGERSVVS